MEIGYEEGRELLKLARKAIERYVAAGDVIDPPAGAHPALSKKCGVFVTLLDGKGDLRGCIGLPYPDKPLSEGLVEGAISACSKDPRFPPVSKEELASLKVEVSVLTEPQLMEVKSPLEYPQRIKLGVHGLIFRLPWTESLFLPQVPIEQGWDSQDYLSYLCMKAGAPPDAWLSRESRIYTFETECFSERE